MQYIGKESGKKFSRRRGHLEAAKNGSKLYFHCALRKRPEAFRWRILENDIPEDKLNVREKYWIKRLKSQSPNGYNLTAGGDGVCDLSEESRARWRCSIKQWWADPTHRQRMVLTHLGKPGYGKGKRRSPEIVAKIKEVLSTPEMKALKREIALAQWKTEDRRIKQIKAMTGNRNGVGNKGWLIMYEKRWGKTWAGLVSR